MILFLVFVHVYVFLKQCVRPFLNNSACEAFYCFSCMLLPVAFYLVPLHLPMQILTLETITIYLRVQ